MNEIDFRNQDDALFRPVVAGWLEKMNIAMRRKQKFNDTAEQCMGFFCGSTGFMWEDKFKKKFIKGSLSPKFKMTIAKAFELVAVIGPILYWQNPQRLCRSRKQTEFTQDVFGPLGDPMAQMLFQQSQQQEGQRQSVNHVRNQLAEQWLNYTPEEQPGEGLASHCEKAITETLVKGMGIVWPGPYQHPGSQRVVTGSFYDTVDNLLIDPDAETLEDAYWVAQRCVHPVWKVEREYGLAPKSLKGNMESAWSMGEKVSDPNAKMDRQTDRTFDYVTYYKIWSKGGIGARLTNITMDVRDQLDEAIGDYAYIVVSAGCDFALNCPPKEFKSEPMQPDDLQRKFDWPIPYWKDDRWPFAGLDFYRKPRDVWPIAPLSPGMGELVFLNVMMSHIADSIWTSSRNFMAILRSACKNFKPIIESGDTNVMLEIDDVLGKGDIRQLVTFLQQPQMNAEVWTLMDRVSENFDKRVGLTEMIYGLNAGGVQSRTAADSNNKQQNLSVRPDYMAKRVEKWQNEISRMEKLCMRWFVEPNDVIQLVGPTGAYLWQKLITDEPPDVVIAEMECTVAAGSARKPNKDREAQNLQAVMQSLAQELSHHADMTYDTNPINSLIKQYGDSIDQDLSGLKMGPRQPAPPPPEQMQAEQAAMQQEQAMAQQESQAKLAAIQAKVQGDQQKAQMDMQAEGLKLQNDQQRMGMEQQAKMIEMQMEGQAQQQELGQKQELNQMDVLMKMLEQKQKGEANRMEMAHDKAKFDQDSQQDALQFSMDARQKQVEGRQQLQLQKQQGTAQVAQTRAMAAAKPKPKPGAGGKR